MNAIDKALMELDVELNAVEESTSREVDTYYSSIANDITYLRAELQNAKIVKDKKKIKQICEYGLKTCSEYYRTIEAIPESRFDNYADNIIMHVNQLSHIAAILLNMIVYLMNPISSPVAVTSFGLNSVNFATSIFQEYKNIDQNSKYRKDRLVNDMRFGNKNRVGHGNNKKEACLRIISDLIVLFQKELQELKTL